MTLEGQEYYSEKLGENYRVPNAISCSSAKGSDSATTGTW